MILIVDDDEGMGETCSMLLEAHGYEVATVQSGKAALESLRTVLPELILSDYTMPEMNGGELTELVKADPKTAMLPAILMTASMKCEIEKPQLYDGFLRKPFRAENLLLEVRKLLAKVDATSEQLAST